MRKLFLLIACMMFLSGCTQSNIVQPDSETKIADPDFEKRDGIEIDWTQVSTDAEENFEDQNLFPYARDFQFYLEPNKKEIMLMWVVADDLPADEILMYAEDLIKGFNDTVATQDFSIERSTKDSYGGLWKNYSLSFSIVPESSQDDEESWFMSASFGAGVEFVLPDAKELQNRVNAAEDSGGIVEEQDEDEAEDAEAADDAGQAEDGEAAAE
ncbi:MAG: hypothetical protein HFG46_10740 [Clostridium sp.]|nr:hypothetical protein [Clostridium sp.]